MFWRQDGGGESPVTSIPETDPKEAGLTEGRGSRGKGEGPKGAGEEDAPRSSFIVVSWAFSSVTKMEWGHCLP